MSVLALFPREVTGATHHRGGEWSCTDAAIAAYKAEVFHSALETNTALKRPIDDTGYAGPRRERAFQRGRDSNQGQSHSTIHHPQEYGDRERVQGHSQ